MPWKLTDDATAGTHLTVSDYYAQHATEKIAMSTPIMIVLQTYKRTDYALPTIAAIQTHLKYDGPILWYVADDGSPTAHVDAVLDALKSGMPDGQEFYGHHTERLLYGGNCNRAWWATRDVTPLTFWLEDDWVLSQDVDLTPYASLLMEREDIGMVRLGYLNTGIRGEAIGHRHNIYWKLEREPVESHQLVFAGHPSLRHERYWLAYGEYPVISNPGETELLYAYKYRIGNGPAVVWPVGWPQWGHFQHIGETKTETML